TWVFLNEPDVYKDPDDFHTFAGTPNDYAQMLKVGYLAARSVNPNAKIVMSGLTYFWDKENTRPQYFQRVLDALRGDPTAPANNIKSMALARAAGVQRYSPYKLQDEFAENGDEYWGLTRNDGTVRPGYLAYQVAVRYLQDARSATYYWSGSQIPPSDQEITS